MTLNDTDSNPNRYKMLLWFHYQGNNVAIDFMWILFLDFAHYIHTIIQLGLVFYHSIKYRISPTPELSYR